MQTELEPKNQTRFPLRRIIGKNGKRIFFIVAFLSVLIITFLMSSCASDGIGSPCPNYGESCMKTPINSWTGSGG